jgi:Glycosyl transferase family 2
MSHNLFVLLPTARGVHPQTLSCLFDTRTELEQAGHRLHLATVYRMPLDLARNELVTAFLSTTADMAWMLDDDCQVAPEWVPRMLTAIDAGCDIVSAPCKLRDHSHGGAQDFSPYNVRPLGKGSVIGGLRVDECDQTGLGSVIVSRRVLEKLHAEDQHYASRLMPGKPSAAIFTSRVEKASNLMGGAPEDLSVYTLDDVVFSLKVRKLGFKIHAAIDVPTCHDGMRGCFSEELEKLERAQRKSVPSGLVGADGKSIR